ncbi:hypothetical protein [Aureimonas sp. D3]|uniref:hypothetical protein n=1 Tax=Aureimonas sp. D3 TaxID=1638164 RepID=UPI0007803359|nr:hypothetical protein [Aureimonas sp. D3]
MKAVPFSRISDLEDGVTFFHLRSEILLMVVRHLFESNLKLRTGVSENEIAALLEAALNATEAARRHRDAFYDAIVAEHQLDVGPKPPEAARPSFREVEDAVVKCGTQIEIAASVAEAHLTDAGEVALDEVNKRALLETVLQARDAVWKMQEEFEGALRADNEARRRAAA